MFKDIKQQISEILEIVKVCPENLQEKCFEILLLVFLQDRMPARPLEAKGATAQTRHALEDDIQQGGEPTTQEDIAQKDLHVKARKFLKDKGISMEEINQIFYRENGDFKPLYDDLKTTKLAESQIRLALLEALEKVMKDGDFEFDGESIRGKCQDYKCYDSANYTSNFKSRAKLFDGFDKYESGTPIKLSNEGKNKLAELIKALAK